MTKRIVVIALLLIGGAILNVIVAWGIAGFSSTIVLKSGNYRDLSDEAAAAYWLQNTPAAWHDAAIVAGTEAWTFGRMETVVIAQDIEQPRLVAAGRWDMGWPWLALRFTSQQTVVQGVEDAETRWGLWLKGGWFRECVLPLLPLWPGFALNTLLYAGLLWMFFMMPFALRRKRRMRRGLCAACAYPIGMSAVCTECGRAVRTQAAASAVRAEEVRNSAAV